MKRGTTAIVAIGLLATTPITGEEIRGVPLSVALQDAAAKARALTIAIKRSDGSTLKAVVIMHPQSISYRRADKFVESIQSAIAGNRVVTLEVETPSGSEKGGKEVYRINGPALVDGVLWWLGEDPIVITGSPVVRSDPWKACRTGEKGVAWIKANCPTF